MAAKEAELLTLTGIETDQSKPNLGELRRQNLSYLVFCWKNRVTSSLIFLTRGPMHEIRARIGLHSCGSCLNPPLQPWLRPRRRSGRTSGLISVLSFYYYR
ncbi:hypothetical protein QTO34_007726 [Cnephaeus nilssonii]|uniref:Uncharacterized protein n=1 Tax=Cnephaeus nilssonii TaxID=3371016 RepID=A0AA40HJR4_CNENI|nr:hypothetical protein QTO34_007726 [Eptesicus nilssonii]